MFDFLNLIKKRRSCYFLNEKSDVSKENIIHYIKECLKHTPTSFNSQTGRIIVLFNTPYKDFWISTGKILKKITPNEQFEKTKEKILSFSNGIGSILFFEEQHTISALEEKFPLYKDNFPIWSNQSSGMLQYAIWLSLTELGLGANLQHYNPLIDEMVHEKFQLPTSWQLIAQMNFGGIEKNPREKTFLDVNKRIKIFE